MSTPDGPFELSMTVANCENVELVIRNEPDGEAIASGIDRVNATLERGEAYTVEARRHDQEIGAWQYKPVGKQNPELYLERCES